MTMTDNRFEWNRRRVFILLACVLVSAISWASGLDRWIALGMPEWLSPTGKVIFEKITILGDSVWWLVPSLVGWIALVAIQRRADAKRVIYVGISVAASGLLGIGIKMLVGRWRPGRLVEDGLYGINPFSFSLDHSMQSFPSGHSTTALSVAVALAVLVPKARIPLLIAGVVIAVSRVPVGMHFFSDVVMGSCLGWITAEYFAGLMRITPFKQ